MSAAAAVFPRNGYRSGAFLPIFWGGLLCGILDISAAFVTWGIRGVKPIRILQSVASGLLGAKSFQGGVSTALLGLVFHFLIAFTAATVFYAASRKIGVLVRRPVIAGVLYGISVYLFMYWIVIPLSAVRGAHFRFLPPSSPS